MIRVLIADAHPVTVEGLKSLLIGTGMQVVGAASSLEQLRAKLKEGGFDIVILDARLEGGEALESLQRFRADHPTVQVVVYSGSDNPKFVSKAISGGAAGYILKSAPIDSLISCVKTAAEGGACWTREEVRRTSVALAAPRVTANIDAPLTQREAEVLRRVVLGRTNKQIATDLGISYETVKEHVQHVLEKVGVADRTQAAIWAVRLGIF